MANQTTNTTESSALEQELQRVATEKAYTDWDDHYGYGLYHTGPVNIEAEIVKARKTVDKWYNMLEAAIRADERAKS